MNRREVVVILVMVLVGVALGWAASKFLTWKPAPVVQEISGDFSSVLGGASCAVLTDPSCPACKAADEYLRERSTQCVAIVFSESDRAKQLYISLRLQGVPTLFTRNKAVSGFSPVTWDKLLD